jgi:hypothetical protein
MMNNAYRQAGKGGIMQSKPGKLKHEFKSSFCMGIALFVFVGIIAGCASTYKTTKTTTTKTTEASPAEEGNKGYFKNTATVGTSNAEQKGPVTQKSDTTTTTTDTKAEHHSILGSTFHAIGWVIALPFRLIGGLIGWIF